ncbi:MAG: CBS domain-containing protein [Myxococcales bacterium]|nr:CBS domain-containing protein [Myxococcales bacterium]
MNVRELLEKKGRAVHVVPAIVTIQQAMERMNRDGVHSLVVMDGGDISGIFTERDALKELAVYGADGLGHTVDAAMSWHPIYATEDMSVEEACQVMERHGIRHLPVVTDGTLMGLVSLQDALSCWLTICTCDANRLRSYIVDNFGG